jgi:hypothetical protein
MKTKLTLLSIAVISSITTNAFAQGSLTPPIGAPAPVMKSLDQIESRIPLVAGQPGVSVGAGNAITITNNGSYYLTGNLTVTATSSHGIDLGNNSATIDLNGYCISMPATTTSAINAISITGQSGQMVQIRNGMIRGGGTNVTSASGIYLVSPLVGNVLVENVQCHNVYQGIYLNENDTSVTMARNCSVEKTGASGIVAHIVTGCTVRTSGGRGIAGETVSDCLAFYAYEPAIEATTVMNCTAYNPTRTAIKAAVANGCYALGGTNLITYKYNMP